MLVRTIVYVLLLLACTSGCALAQEEKSKKAASSSKENFCWPLENFRYSLNAPTGAWLAPRRGGASHLGVDMFTAVGQPARAIADGVVYEISNGGWGAGNVAVMIRHRLADGRTFVALYGHIRNSRNLRVGDRVRACQTVGTIGPYRYAGNSHLHFGVVAPGKEPRAPYGTSKRPDRNNFIDPLNFLQTQSPQQSSSPSKVVEASPPPAPAQKEKALAPAVTSKPPAAAPKKKLTNPQPVKKEPRPAKKRPKAQEKKAAKTLPVLKPSGKSPAP